MHYYSPAVFVWSHTLPVAAEAPAALQACLLHHQM
jgi:hypothetical protein